MIKTKKYTTLCMMLAITLIVIIFYTIMNKGRLWGKENYQLSRADQDFCNKYPNLAGSCAGVKASYEPVTNTTVKSGSTDSSKIAKNDAPPTHNNPSATQLIRNANQTSLTSGNTSATQLTRNANQTSLTSGNTNTPVQRR